MTSQYLKNILFCSMCHHFVTISLSNFAPPNRNLTPPPSCKGVTVELRVENCTDRSANPHFYSTSIHTEGLSCTICPQNTTQQMICRFDDNYRSRGIRFVVEWQKVVSTFLWKILVMISFGLLSVNAVNIVQANEESNVTRQLSFIRERIRGVKQ